MVGLDQGHGIVNKGIIGRFGEPVSIPSPILAVVVVVVVVAGVSPTFEIF